MFRGLLALVGLMAAFCAAPLLAQAPVEKKDEARKTPPRFIRVQREKDIPVALQTAIVRYVPESGKGELVVDLVSVVHIGDRAYYDRLNQRLDQYDVVLYELVAPPGTRIPKGGRKDADNPLALVLQLARFFLEVELQTERIDYTRKHFVHADLSPEQMAAKIRERGDDELTLFLSITADLLRQQNLQEMNRQQAPPRKEAEPDLAQLLTDPQRGPKLKRALAEQMETLESSETGLGRTLDQILIADRNQACLKVFQKELAGGKKKIAIFYGAAHMPDFEKRLQDDFGLKRHSEEWLTAWDLRDRKRTPEEEMLRLLRLLGQ
jgi:hypothetical protein